MVKTSSSDWYNQTEVRVCAGSELSMKASTFNKLQSCEWNGPNGFKATTALVSIPKASSADAGIYKIMVVDSFGCSTEQNLTVKIDSFPSPILLSNRACGTSQVNVSLGNTTGTVRWYDTPSGGKPLAEGSSFKTPLLNKSKDYYYELSTIDTFHLGAVDTSIGTTKYIVNGNGSTGEYGLEFFASKNFMLKSVKMYVVDTIFHRTIYLMQGGPMRQTQIPNKIGEQRVALNWWVPAGIGYQIKPSFAHLWSNISGVAYPYSNSLATITKSSGDYEPMASEQYHYFYDWIMVSDGCIAPRVKVEAIIDTPTAASLPSLPILYSGQKQRFQS
ncbi:MAG: hypothetical protein IPO21_05745 [Bacteroidales bacterium]|nr:hypothetical protein [Bacteroidales bacterium]